MKKLFIGLSLLFITIISSAQDLLITKQNDSINCKIKELKNDQLIYNTFIYNHYSQKSIDTISVAATFINYHIQEIKDPVVLSSLHSHYIITHSSDTIYCNLIQDRDTYVAYSELISGKEIIKAIPKYSVDRIIDIKVMKREREKVVRKKNEKIMENKMEIKFGLASAHRLEEWPSNVSSGYKKLNKELASGYTIKAKFNYIFKGKWGVGVFYSRFGSSGAGSIPFLIDSEVWDLPISLDAKINYISAQGLFQLSSKEGNYRLAVNASFGRLSYDEVGKIDGIYTSSRGACLGLGFGFDFTYYLSDKFGVALDLDIITGSIKKVDMYIGEENTEIKLDGDSKLNVSYLDFGVGIVFRF